MATANAPKELTLEEALAKLAAQETRIASLESEVDEATEITSDLQEQLANATAGQEIGQAVVVTHAKEQYKVLAPKFQHKGVEYKSSDLSTNADLVKELVEGNSGLLHKLEKAKK
ncbi:MAG TPA: hypothetical protein VF690_03600 [Hymenobacter sp.]|jgi:hypothetical protein